MKKEIIGVFFCMLFSTVAGQTTQELQKLSWKQIATKMPQEWYGSPEAKDIADKLLLYQSDLGGFPKNIAFHKEILASVQPSTIMLRLPRCAFLPTCTHKHMINVIKMPFSRLSTISIYRSTITEVGLNSTLIAKGNRSPIPAT